METRAFLPLTQFQNSLELPIPTGADPTMPSCPKCSVSMKSWSCPENGIKRKSCVLHPSGRKVTAAGGLHTEMAALAKSNARFPSQRWLLEDLEEVFGGFFRDASRLGARPSAPIVCWLLTAAGRAAVGPTSRTHPVTPRDLKARFSQLLHICTLTSRQLCRFTPVADLAPAALGLSFFFFHFVCGKSVSS